MSEQILPFYLVCDESGSMAMHIDEMNNELLPDLQQAIGTDPVTADKTRFSIIGFAEDARVLLEMTDLSELSSMPGLVARGTTHYGSAFALVQQQIESDVKALKAQGTKVFRPAVFFLSDGHSSDSEWRKAHAALTDPSWPYHPNIISFGIGDSDAATISAVGTFKAFIVDDGVKPGDALREFASALTRSITASGSTVPAPGAPLTLQVPDQIPGFTALPVDAL
jgi:uncharacterized protein YegL